MDIKSKNNRRILCAVLLVLFCTVITLSMYSVAEESIQEMGLAEKAAEGSQSWPNYNSDSETNLKSFIRYIYAGSYGMYWELAQKEGGTLQTPAEVFLPVYVAQEKEEGEESDITASFNESFSEWYSGFTALMESYQVEYQIVNGKTGGGYTNAAQDLTNLGKEGDTPFFLHLSFDDAGNVSIEELVNQDELSLTASKVGGLSGDRFLDWMDVYGISAAVLELPSNIEVYIYSENPGCYYSSNETVIYSYQYEQAIQDSVGVAYFVLLGVIAAFAMLLPPFRKLRRSSRILAKIPVEAAALAGILVLPCVELAISYCRDYVSDGWNGAPQWLLHVVTYMLLYGIWLAAVMVLLQMLDVGLKQYFKERSFLYRNLDRIWNGMKRLLRKFVEELKTIDLGEKSDSWLLKLVAVNFLILVVCCSLWFFGIFGLMVYSVILFFLLRRYTKQVKESYNVLLEATRDMAQGNLRMDLSQDMGVFNPLKEELAKVNSGFRKAVEQEIRSQNMKTELITNVSHDLKTPLTAIITYVNLLKDESVTPKERRNYVEILDRKSLRLKKLIEDLFEVSKAASGNIKIEKQQVDLGELVKQAAAEQEDRMAEAGIDCRVTVPEQRVLLMLDAEKTYRILENLLINVAKYGLSGTRAYLTVTSDVDTAEIVVKNVSATELPEDVSGLTERFVRGDKARNTEGSGLGLAIVKSFAELQGGSFEILTDGDLFKAIVRF